MLIILFFVVLFATVAIADDCTPGCYIDYGYGPDQCSYYKDNADWLPPNYVFATDCICTDPSLDYSSINCVRKTLQDLHDSEFSDDFKDQARDTLKAFLNGTLSAEAYRSISDYDFASTVISVHKKAYQTCCCPNGPAPAYFWHGIFLWNYPPVCSALRTSQHTLSSCGCTGDD